MTFAVFFNYNGHSLGWGGDAIVAGVLAGRVGLVLLRRRQRAARAGGGSLLPRRRRRGRDDNGLPG